MKKELRKIDEKTADEFLRILCHADGDCKYCSNDLVNIFIKKFGHKDLAEKIFKNKFHSKLEIIN